MKILFLHGLDSKPYQDRIDLLSKYGTVEMPFIDYRTETDVFGRISKIVESFNPDIIIGHSMGGILSYYLSNEYNKTNLMFMPAFFSSNAHFMNVPKDVINLQANNKKLAVIGTHDTAVDNKNTKNVLPANVIHEEPIGHQLSPMILDKYFKKIMGLTEMITTINEFKKHIKENMIKENIGDISLEEIAIEKFNKEFINEINSMFKPANTRGIKQMWIVQGILNDGYFIVDETSYKPGNSYKLINYNLIHSYFDKKNNIQQNDIITSFNKISDKDTFINTCKSYMSIKEDAMMGLDKIGHIAKEVTIELDLKHTQHSLGRQGRGSDYITNEDIKNAVSTATDQMVDLIIANKLNVGDSVLITRKEDRLNVVGALSLKKGTDIINFTVITCMRVEKFLNKNNTLQIFI